MKGALVGTCLLLASAVSGLADHKADIAALRNQIKLLRAEEKVTLKAIKTQYEEILHQDKLSKDKREELKTALKNEEKSLLELTSDKDERQAIKDKYHLLFQILSGEVQLDKEMIAKIRQQEKAHAKLIHTLYAAKIKELELLIAALERKGKGKHPK